MEGSNIKRMDEAFFKDLLRSNFRVYYNTKELNDILYIHYKGLHEIENLEGFTGLKCIYMEGNGFDNNKNLRCLYLHENVIKKIENLGALEELVTLNLSDNFVEKIENLEGNTKLQTLQLKRNHVGTNGLEDLVSLKDYHSIRVLDISNNRIDLQTEEEVEEFIKILESMQSLTVLYMQQNKVCRKIRSYRKTLINRLKNLKYLDDRPVFPEDRRYAEAFARGGLQAEREERKKVKEEKDQERRRNHQAFKDMIEGYKKKKEATQGQESESESEDTQNMETYYTDSNKHTSEATDSKKSQVSDSDVESDSISQTSENKGSVKSDKVELEKGENQNKTPVLDDAEDDVDLEFDAFLTELD